MNDHDANTANKDSYTSYGGFEITDLKAAFDKVANPENWKLPIRDAVVRCEDVNITVVAIAFYTGSAARVTRIHGSDKCTINADGYYIAVGA